MTDWLKANYSGRGYELQGGATEYLNAVGHLIYAWMWLEMLTNLEATSDETFKQRKLVAAEFFTHHLLPIANEQCRRVKAGFETFIAVRDELI